MLIRPTIDSTLMKIATAWESRSTCSRNRVGVIIAKEGRTLGSGYNGAPAGMPHCNHPTMVSGSGQGYARRISPVPEIPVAPMDRGCRIAIHAEANAIAYAARNGVAIEGATAYVTLSPCFSCAQLIIAAGLERVVFNRSYRDPAGTDLLRQAGLTVEQLRL